MRRHAPRSLQVDGGFTLLEILVAISIMAICLTVIFQLFSGGLKSGRLSDDYTRGVFHAREIMEEILVSDALAEGISEGRFNDSYAWKAE
ncbi:MAG: prepilin-type N-terminal cleavage/methylation domain-containing protein, partial [Desulfobulbaceae bacterium]|nr:prepilin-type N-terminal cleavage/methylation domain-containing protein [Desulfobulbaceae bacterium]